jgi:uncharacterized Fe-S cluster protein YjdI
MKGSERKYTNGEVTIVWKPNLCRHSAKCFTGLPNVFNPLKRPWIDPRFSTTGEIIEQVKKCPSGALTTVMNSSMQNQ